MALAIFSFKIPCRTRGLLADLVSRRVAISSNDRSRVSRARRHVILNPIADCAKLFVRRPRFR
jgi:hypothetical protein